MSNPCRQGTGGEEEVIHEVAVVVGMPEDEVKLGKCLCEKDWHQEKCCGVTTE